MIVCIKPLSVIIFKNDRVSLVEKIRSVRITERPVFKTIFEPFWDREIRYYSKKPCVPSILFAN